MKKYEQVINFSDAREMLQMSTDRSLMQFIHKSGIKIISRAESDLSEILLDREDFRKALNVEKLPEKFLTLRDVSNLLGASEAKIKTLCDNGDLPFYRLSKSKGSKLLFIESELINNNYLSIDKLEKFYVKSWKYDLFESFFKSAISVLQQHDRYGKSLDVLNGVLCDDMTLEQVANSLGLSVERAKKLLNESFTDSKKIIRSLLEENETLIQKNKELQAEQAFLRQSVKDLGKEPVTDSANYFSTRLEDMDFSVRVLNCLKAKGIETLGELLNINFDYLLQQRNLGKKSLDEIKDKLAQQGLSLKDS